MKNEFENVVWKWRPFYLALDVLISVSGWFPSVDGGDSAKLTMCLVPAQLSVK